MTAAHLAVEPMETDASSVTSSQNGAPAPTLGQLPPELKSLIVDMVHECDMEDEELGSDDETDGEDEHDCSSHGPGEHHHPSHARSKPKHDCSSHAPGEHPEEEEEKSGTTLGVWALALLDREFSALAQKYIWREVDLGDRLLIEIGAFVIDILPRRAHHIETLMLQQQFQEWDGDMSGSFLGPRMAALGSYEDEDDAALRLRFRRTLLAEVVEALPNLVSVQLDMVDLDEPSLPVHLQQRELTNALRKVGHRLSSSLTIEGDDGGEFVVTEGYLAEFLTSFPNLARLELTLPLDPTGRSDLHSALTSLTSLRALIIQAAEFVNDAFAALPWSAAIETLALSNCDELSLPALRNLLDKFAPTLSVLDLEDVPANITDAEAKKHLHPLSLPKLDTLVLNTTHDVAFLQLFGRSELKSLTIGFCPQIPYLEWEAFITEHAGTLKEVEVQAGHEFTEGQIESLEVLCFAKRIECSVESDSEGDSEGDYTEDEVFDGVDSDDDDADADSDAGSD